MGTIQHIGNVLLAIVAFGGWPLLVFIRFRSRSFLVVVTLSLASFYAATIVSDLGVAIGPRGSIVLLSGWLLLPYFILLVRRFRRSSPSHSRPGRSSSRESAAE